MEGRGELRCRWPRVDGEGWFGRPELKEIAFAVSTDWLGGERGIL